MHEYLAVHGVNIQRWKHATEWLLMGAAAAFLVAYAAPIINPEVSPGWMTLCTAVAWVAWACSRRLRQQAGLHQ